MTTRADLQAALQNGNVRAFQVLIRAGETSQDDSAYTMLFGGGHFVAPPWEHPHQVIHRAGISSSAAGAYQILSETENELVAQYGFEDFSPPLQDERCVALLIRRHALDDVIAGRITDAVQKCNREWASLPGSPYGQPTRTFTAAMETFESAGGIVA